MSSDLVLVTGATGYVGGRLVPRLLEAGYRTRCLVRDPGRLQGRSWADRVEIVQGDVLSSDRLTEALRGVTTAYYLVHSMSGAPDFYQRDLLAANNFAKAAHDAGVQRMIYLGGLGDPAADLSRHLRSRQEVGRVLSSYGVPVTEFRAAIIVGAGSASFEMIRYLTERLPVMICPRWVYTRVQPISIDEVLQYLVDALRTPQSIGRILEIGGADVLTYGDMMLGYARVRGLRRHLIPVPVLTPSLSSYWVHWVTPIPAHIARPLIEGLRNEVIVRDDTARRLFPHIEPVDYLTAVRRALASLNAGEVETAWSDALVNSCGDVPSLVLETREGMIIEQRRLFVQATPEAVYHAFTSLGGERGWLYADWAWHLRGAVDRLIGGVGLRRGRRHPYEVRPGDALDFWRVEAVEPGRLLRLRAEMKLPGDAWLQYEALPQSDGRTLLVQTAFFAPKGLLGFLYWYGLLPAHRLIFTGLLHSVARLAREHAQQPTYHHRNHRQTS
jgi:uncharacterized protein YbjT (DUF2867 family)